MAKFMVLYNSTKNANDTMAQATPEEMQASMQEWIAWRDEASQQVKVEFGLPLQAIGRVTTNGVEPSDTFVSGYSMLEGDKDTILELLKTHPQLKRQGASIELLELLSMPGLETS
jgi:hypothetical protein